MPRWWSALSRSSPQRWSERRWWSGRGTRRRRGTVVRGTVVDVVDVVEVDVVVGAATPVLFGSSTKVSLGVGRPAMATPARPPTTITATAKGQDLRMRSVKLPAIMGGRQRCRCHRPVSSPAVEEEHRRSVRNSDTWVAGIAIAAGVGVVLAGPSPTGSTFVDVVLLVAAVALCIFCHRHRAVDAPVAELERPGDPRRGARCRRAGVGEARQRVALRSQRDDGHRAGSVAHVDGSATSLGSPSHPPVVDRRRTRGRRVAGLTRIRASRRQRPAPTSPTAPMWPGRPCSS